MSRMQCDDRQISPLTLIRERPDHQATGSPTLASHREKLEHLAGLLPELADIARSMQCETLAGLLQVASLEAELRCATRP